MTIQNKEWYSSRVRRLSLSGFSQEEVSIELGISEGTVNAILQELNSLDDTLQLQHEIAIVCKKSGLSIKQLASNLAFSNAIKRLGFEENNIHAILKGIDMACTRDGSLVPDSVAKMVCGLFNLILKNNISLGELYDEIGKKYSELERIKQEIDETKKSLAEIQKKKNKALAEYDLSRKDLNKFTKLREDFEEIGMDFDKREEIQIVLNDIWEMDYDGRSIIDEVKKVRMFKLTISELDQKCKDLERNLEVYQKRDQQLKRDWDFNYAAINILNRLLQNGINHILIFKIFEVISKYQPFISIDDLAKDIDTYGGMEGAIFKKKRELMMLDQIETFNDSMNMPG